MTQIRRSRSALLALALLLLAALALADERIVVVPGHGIHTESDQERCYVIPGSGIYCETLEAAAAARRVIVVGP